MIGGVGIMDVKWSQNLKFKAVFDEPNYQEILRGFINLDKAI
jgi:hypothetical protein